MYKKMNNDELVTEIRKRFAELPAVKDVRSDMQEEGYPASLSDCSEFADFYLIDIPVEKINQLNLLSHEKKLLDFILTFEDSFFFIGDLMNEGMVTGMFNQTGSELKRRKKNLESSAPLLKDSFDKAYSHIREKIEFSDDTSITHLAIYEKGTTNRVSHKEFNERFEAFSKALDEDFFNSMADEIDESLEDIYNFLIQIYEVEYSEYLSHN